MDESTLVSALKKALTDNSDNGWALLQRVPLICNDIREVKGDLKWIRETMWKFLIAILGGVGLIITGVVTALILKGL